MNMSNNTQPSAMNMSNNKQANAAAENDKRVLNLIDLVGKNVPDVMNMSNNTQANAAAENDERVLNLIHLVGKNVPDVMNMSNNTQANVAAENDERVLNLIDLVGKNVPDVVENIDVDTQLKLGPSRRHPVENTDVDTQLKLEFSKDPVENIDVSESVNSVDTQLSFSVHQDFRLPVEVAATTEPGDGAIPIPRKKQKISGEEGSSKWNERLMEECHITPIAALELVVENGQMADAPENGGLRRSTRPRKPNTRLKGYELYDPKVGYYLNE